MSCPPARQTPVLTYLATFTGVTAAEKQQGVVWCFLGNSRTSASKNMNPEPFTRTTFSSSVTNSLTHLGKSPLCLLTKNRNGVDGVQIQLCDFLGSECQSNAAQGDDLVTPPVWQRPPNL